MRNKILIISINQDHRFLLNRIFTSSGFLVDAPEDISLCQEMIQNHNYDKVILDYDYKNDRSRVVCNFLEKKDKLGMCVVIQDITDEDLAEKVYAQGGYVIHKPYNIDSLINATNTHTSKQKN